MKNKTNDKANSIDKKENIFCLTTQNSRYSLPPKKIGYCNKRPQGLQCNFIRLFNTLKKPTLISQPLHQGKLSFFIKKQIGHVCI